MNSTHSGDQLWQTMEDNQLDENLLKKKEEWTMFQYSIFFMILIMVFIGVIGCIIYFTKYYK